MQCARFRFIPRTFSYLTGFVKCNFILICSLQTTEILLNEKGHWFPNKTDSNCAPDFTETQNAV